MSVLTPDQEEDFDCYTRIGYDDPESDVYVLRLQTIYNFFYLVENLGLPMSEIDVEYTSCLSGWYGDWNSPSYCHFIVGWSKIGMYVVRPGEETIYHNGLVADFDFDTFRPILASIVASE